MRNKKKQWLAVLGVVGIVLAGCSATGVSGEGTTGAATSSAIPSESAAPATTSSDDGRARLDAIREVAETAMQSGDIWTTAVTATDATVESVMAENQKPHAGSDDDEWSADGATTIALSGTTATVTGEGAQSGDGVVTIGSAGTYVLSGDFTGQVVVDTADEGKVRLVLDGVNITNDDDAAIRIVSADEAVVILADGSKNSLADTSAYAADADGTGALVSKADLTIGGTGALAVTGNATNAISSSDGLVIMGGTITVTSVDDGIRGKDYVVIAGGDITVEAVGDAVQATNDEDLGRGYFAMFGGSLTVTGADKAIDAVSDVVMDGGTWDFTSTGDTVEAAYIVLVDGSGRIVSGDDAINATGDGGVPWISVVGGQWTLNAAGDGFDSNGDGHISGGAMTVYGPTDAGNGAIDVQNGLTVSGGVLFAAGSVGMDEAPSLDSPQVSIKFQVTNAIAAGSTVAILDANGTQITSYTAEKTAQSVVFSSPDIVAGEQYTLQVDGSAAGTAVGGEYTEMMGPGGGMPGGMPGGGMPGGGEMPGGAPGGGEMPEGGNPPSGGMPGR